MKLVDANVFMYVAGGQHRFKAPATRFLEAVAAGEHDAAVDAEILQEILHRYRAIGRWRDGCRLFDLVLASVPTVLAIDERVVRAARQLMDRHAFLGARDAIHAAVVGVHELDGLVSFDRDFDRLPGLRRIEPS